MIAIIIVLVLFLFIFNSKDGEKNKPNEMYSGTVLNEGKEHLSVYDFRDRTAELVDAVCAKSGKDFSKEVLNFLNEYGNENFENKFIKIEEWIDYGDPDAFLEFLDQSSASR